MRKINLIDPLYMAFYSRELYREVAVSWSTGLCFLYLLSLVALCWIPGMIRLDTDLTSYINVQAPKYVMQMPDIEISKGEASIKEKQPFLIKDPDTGETVIIIDTTGQVRSLENSKALVLLTNKKLLLKSAGTEQTLLEMRQFKDSTVTRSLVFEWLESFTEWFAFMFYPFAVIFSFIMRIAEVLILALIGFMFSRVMRVGHNYQTIIRLCAIAMTPLMIFDGITTFFNIDVFMPLVTDLLMASGYLIFAIRSSYSEMRV
jgi:hypothetical protein